MQKFSELTYTRPDMAAARKDVEAFIAAIENAKSWEELNAAILKSEESSNRVFTQYVIASVRNTCDVTDEYYEKEMEYLDSEAPALAMLSRKADAALLASPFIGEYEKTYGSILVKGMKADQRFANEKLIPLQIKESELQNRYSKASAMAQTEFKGKQMNFYGLLKEMLSTDRDNRAAAMEAWADLYAQIAPELDAIYDEMAAIRNEMAAIVGFDSYTDMAYLQRSRYDYTQADVAAFHKQVKEVITPACAKLYEAQRKRLGIDKLEMFDENMVFPDGNATPQGTKDELLQKAMEMYSELSPETKEFFTFMMEHELFDLETRTGKRPGGYCTSLSEYKAPFIFSNFNGTAADVDVLTHEAGHAFEYYTASRLMPLGSMVHSTSEINEIHSMAMEHFAYPWMEKFFGDQTQRYLYGHLWGALNVIPYMCCVDEFQHRVYNEKLDAAGRRACWHELEQEYMPWRSYNGNQFLEEGGFWMQKQHIFLFPFYYIEYALAQVCAFQFYLRSVKNREAAWADYMALCRAGGSLGYFELLELAHLENPFREGTVERAVADVVKAIEEMEV